MTTIGDPDVSRPPPPPEPPSPETEGVAPPVRPDRPFVLVVDDSDDLRALLRDVLAPHGYEVATAASSGRALSLMAQRVPDLVITDLMMPGMSGISLRSHMLRRPDLAGVPVIVLSAYWARPAETLNAVAVLTKPVDLDTLVESVERALAGTIPG